MELTFVDVLQILCPHSSAMDPLFPDEQRGPRRRWRPLPTLWRPAGSRLCPVTRASSAHPCRGHHTKWPAERATACQRRHTCLAVWETCPTSTAAQRNPSSPMWAPCRRMEMQPGITTQLNPIMKTSSSVSPGECRSASLRTIDTMNTMNTTSKDFLTNTPPQRQADPPQVIGNAF